MSEELKIEVDVKANDDSAKKTLDNLIKEYNDKSLEFQVKLDKFDISGINNSITKLTSDLNKLSNIEFDSLNKLETNLKNINKLLDSQNKLSGNNIISENTGLENKIKEYLDLDKKINDAFTKLSKAELNRNDEVITSLNKEIDLLRQKQALVTLDLRSNSGFSDEVREQVRLQEELNKAISQTQQAEYKTSFIDKLHTEAKKATNNIEKTINQLATAYRQVDNEITRLIKSRDKLEVSGDYKTVQVLDKQISSWKEMQQGIENAAKSAKVYDQVMEKVQNSISKNKNSIDINKSQLEVNIEVNNEKALKKFEEFKTKALSNIQEIERKYEGTDLFDEAKNQANELRQTLVKMEDTLKKTGKIDLSLLSGSMRDFNQEVTQTKRDLNDLNKNLKGGFFSNFGEEFTSNLMSFTAGELLADSIRSVASSLKDLVLEYDTAMANLKKVANPADIMNESQLDAIKDKAVSIAKDVGMASQDVIQAISDTIQTGGYGMEEATKIAEQTMMLANVAEMTQEAASEGVVTMLSAFKLDPLKEIPVVVDGVTKSTNELTNAMDKINYVGNNFAISSDGILSAITSGANVLAEYGVSMNDTVAMIASANTTLQDSSRVGNGLKTIAINLAGIKANASNGTLELNKTAKALTEIAGISVFENEQTGELKNMPQLIDEIASKWGSFTEQQRAGLSEAIAGK